MKQSIKQNLILVIMTLMTLVATFFIGLGLTMPSVVALEQDARCGIAEHVHRDDCYLNNVLICGKKAHTHGENCYLLRLEDNDINRLLSEIEADEEKSLEHVITNVVYEASYLKLVSEGLLPEPTPTPTPTPTPLLELLPTGSSLDSLTATNEGVANINRSITDNSITPTIYLNERLITPASEGEPVSPDKNLVNLIEGETSPTNLVTYATGNSTDNGGISTLAVEAEPSKEKKWVDVYINLDGDRVCIGSVPREVTHVTSGSGCNKQTTSHYEARLTSISSLLQNCGITISADTLHGNSYTFQYYTSEDATLRDVTKPTDNTNRIRFDNTDSQYSIVLTANFYTVSIRYDDGTPTQTQYVQSGNNSTLTVDTSVYDYFSDPEYTSRINDNQVRNRLNNITVTTTLYAHKNVFTVMFVSDGLVYDTQYAAKDGSGKVSAPVPPPTLAGHTFGGWYIDVACTDGNEYNFNANVTSNLTLYAKWVKNAYTVTFIDENGYTSSRTVRYKDTVIFAPLPDENWVWFGSNKKTYPGGAISDPIMEDITFTATEQLTATFIYKDFPDETRYYTSATNIVLPALTDGRVWVDELGVVYMGNQGAPVDRHKVFTEKGRITLNYTINAPNSIGGENILQVEPPRIDGTLVNETTAYVIEGQNTVILSITPRILTAPNPSNYDEYNYQVTAFMNGWEIVDRDERLQPNSTHSYEELSLKATNGVIELIGNWDSGNQYTANFFVEYDSKMNSSGNASQFTPSIMTTYAGGNYVPSTSNAYTGVYVFGGVDSDKTREYDETIRAMEGYRDGTGKDNFWFYQIPSDEFVFDYLKKYINEHGNGMVTVEDQQVDVDALNDETYTVRWHSVEYFRGSGFHVNAILVNKVGKIHVTKTFDGRQKLVDLAKDGFTITATSGSKSKTLEIKESTDYGADGGYIVKDANGKTWSVPEDNYYVWEISDVHAGEAWTITENLAKVSDGVGFGEWLIVDSTNKQGNGGVGTVTTVTGITFPKDTSSDEWLRADFTNVYLTENSLLIRKIDGNTGARIDGAVFELWQNGQIMTFSTQDSEGNVDGRYHYKPDGSGPITQIRANGTEINTDAEANNFSYDKGIITVREVVTPNGYDLAGEVQVGHLDGEDSPIGVVNNVNLDPDDPPADITKPSYTEKVYAYYENGVLVIKNYATTVDVIAKKEWLNCAPDQWADSVEVQLYANDSASLAAQLVGKDDYGDPIPTIVTLNATTNSDGNPDYETYTWKDLPAYAAGSEVTWSLKEIRIGDEKIKADGSFPNWVSYPGIVEMRTDSYGKTVYTITVSNTPKSGTELMLLKTDMEKTTSLAGAAFTLTDLNDSSFIDKTGVTDGSGRILFSGLKYDTDYTITELTAPDGYWLNKESFTVRISSDTGMVTVTSANGLAEPGSTRLSILVKNLSAEPLPETGGTGTHIYTAGGLLLMAAAMALLIYRRKRRKEADLLDV